MFLPVSLSELCHGPCHQRQVQRDLRCVAPRIVQTPAFDVLFAFLILTNAVFIGHLLACFVFGVPDSRWLADDVTIGHSDLMVRVSRNEVGMVSS